MLIEIALTDHKNEFWELLLPCVFKKNKHGLYIMWVYCRPPDELRHYQEIPLPVFTEWWEPC